MALNRIRIVSCHFIVKPISTKELKPNAMAKRSRSQETAKKRRQSARWSDEKKEEVRLKTLRSVQERRKHIKLQNDIKKEEAEREQRRQAKRNWRFLFCAAPGIFAGTSSMALSIVSTSA